ncbi:MAG: InlB B-repeat-containing protein [Bacilli bacterium]|nr:InlB B-repeat-containing protein [Bacilli bacterium]
MKKILFGVAALGLLGLAGAGLGLKAQDTVEAKAEVPAYVYFEWTGSDWETWGADISDMYAYFFDGATAKGSAWRGDKAVSTETVSEKQYAKFAVPSGATGVVFNFLHDGWDADDWTHQTNDLSIPVDGKNAFRLTEQNNYKYDGSWFTLGSISRTITKYAVYDGVLDDETPLDTDDVEDGETYAIPGSILQTGYHFAGWFTNEACTAAYEATTITGNISLYAKYTTLVADKYIYYVSDKDSETSNNIYSFGGDKEFGDWPGTLVTGVAGETEVHGTLSFDGKSRNIYRIPFASEAADTHIIFNGGGDQTGDLPLAHKTAYWFESNGQIRADADAGSAIEFLLEAESIRNAVTKTGGAIADYSICGISSSNASSLCAKYKALTAEAKAYVDAAETYTYLDKTATDEGLVSYSDIMAQLALIAGVSLDSASSVQYMENKDPTALLIGSISVLSVAGIGLIAYSRKRRAE